MRRLASICAAIGLLVTLPTAAAAADPEFGRPGARWTFLTGISFEQPLGAGLASGTTVEIVISESGTDAAFVALVPAAAGNTTLRYTLETPSGAAIPGTKFTARWRLTPAGGEPALGPEIILFYEDDRFDWHTVSGDVVQMHWYAGSDAFGRQALAIAEDGVAEAAGLLGVEERDPINFYIYADVEPFRDAIGPASRENVGGVAYPESRTMLARIDPAGIGDSWIRTVIPHELSHIVFGSAVENPYHFPPKWLNEGLAVYLSDGYSGDDRATVEEAVNRGTMMPLSALVGQFPTSFERFILGYAESVSAVDYLVRTHGQDKLVELIRSYAGGVSDDEAFRAVLGVDVAGFETAWLADLGAAAPKAYGPQSAPAGPLPEGWDVDPTGAPIASASPGTSPTPTPAAIPQPGDRTDAVSGTVLAVAGLLIVLALAGGGLWWRRRTTLKR